MKSVLGNSVELSDLHGCEMLVANRPNIIDCAIDLRPIVFAESLSVADGVSKIVVHDVGEGS